MQAQTANTFEEFNFKIPSQRQDIIKVFKFLMKTFKIVNEPKSENQTLREQMRGDFFKYSGAFTGVFTDVNADDMRMKKGTKS